MSVEAIVLLSAWVITIALLFFFVPRNKLREAILILFFKQFITWIIGLIVVELRLIEYPVRLFQYANRTSFSFEYFIYPAICVLFNLYYPENRKTSQKGLHYFYYCTVMTLIEVVIEKYTAIANYITWEWYHTWITLFITFYLSRRFYLWFFRLGKKA